MNEGIIAARYAKALLKLTQENGTGATVCSQVRALLADASQVPSDSLLPEVVRMVALLRSKGRGDLLKRVMTMFVSMYHASENIKLAHLTTAVPSADLGDRLVKLLSDRTGARIELETSVNPDLIGGFVLEIDDYLLDASVRNQIEAIRRQFVEKNTRIV